MCRSSCKSWYDHACFTDTGFFPLNIWLEENKSSSCQGNQLVDSCNTDNNNRWRPYLKQWPVKLYFLKEFLNTCTPYKYLKLY